MGVRRDTERGAGGNRLGRLSRRRPVAGALLCALAAAAWLVPASASAERTFVQVRVVGSTETLFEGPVWTEGHDIKASSDTEERPCDGIDPLDPENVTPGATPTAAAVDGMAILDESFDGVWYSGLQDYLITRWGPESSPSWGVFVNGTLLEVGGCQYELHEDDEVLWSAGSMTRPLLGLFAEGAGVGSPTLTAQAALNVPFTVEVGADTPKARKQVPPLERSDFAAKIGATVAPVQTAANGFETPLTEAAEAATTNAEGKASITFTSSGWHRIMATAPGTVRSNRLDVCVPAPATQGCGVPPAEDEPRRAPPEKSEPSPHTEPEVKSEEPIQSEPKKGENATTGSPAPVSSPAPVNTATRGLRIDGLTLVPFAATSPNLHYRGHWRRRVERGALDGAIMQGRGGATVTVKLARGRPAFILRDMPRAARVEVRAGGGHRTFALRGSRSAAPRLLLAAGRAHAGTVTLRVIAGTVGIDGVAVTP
jgi:hypothetical protein